MTGTLDVHEDIHESSCTLSTFFEIVEDFILAHTGHEGVDYQLV